MTVSAMKRREDSPQTTVSLAAKTGRCLRSKVGNKGGRGEGVMEVCGYEVSQGWLRHSPAEALFSGTISSMGSRN